MQARAKGMEKQLQCGDGEEHETRAERTKYKMKKKKWKESKRNVVRNVAKGRNNKIEKLLAAH